MATPPSATAATPHQIATHRSLRVLVEWAVEFAKQAQSGGRRVLWAPAHALGGCVSLRTWILDQAAQALGDAAPEEGPLLLSGAADTIIIIDPASADAASLNWLTDMLACSEEVADLAAVPPLPQLVVLAPSRGSGDGATGRFLSKLESVGAVEVRATGRGNDGAASAPDLSDVLGRNDELLAGLALSPVPLTLADLNALAAATGKSGLPVGDLVSSPLLQIAGDYVVPSAAEVTRRLREQLPPETLARGATLLLPIVEARYETLVDARVDLALRSGDTRRAGKLARRRFDEHLAAGRVEEALRMIEMARALGLSVESGRFAAETDDAKLAYLYALAGRHEPAADTVRRLARRRDAYGSADFVQWLALAARHLALHAGFEVRLTDSLLRRAIRLAGDDTSTHVRLTLLRVELLASPIMNLEERSSWLLSHINGEMLEDISPDVLAQYLEDTAHRMWRAQDVRGAMRRLRKLLVMERPDRQMARGMLLMARCRQVVADSDAALRFATGSLHHALRANDLSLVTQAAAFVREELARRPRELPKLAPKAAKGRPRIPAMADVAPPPLAEADRLFEILQARFGAAFWVRRRGETLRTFGKEQRAEVPVSVGQETDGGWRRVSRGPDGETRALVLLRADGSDMVVFEAGGEADLREDALARMLLADREVTGATTAQPPSRRTVLEDYHRRAVAHGGDRGLHATMEMLFNKDVLLYFEEQGIGKEEMAEKLGVSRATLYRMYARAGLNI